MQWEQYWDKELRRYSRPYTMLAKPLMKHKRITLPYKGKFLINVMHHHMEDNLKKIEQPIKFSNQVFISLLYSKTILNG